MLDTDNLWLRLIATIFAAVIIARLAPTVLSTWKSRKVIRSLQKAGLVSHSIIAVAKIV